MSITDKEKKHSKIKIFYKSISADRRHTVYNFLGMKFKFKRNFDYMIELLNQNYNYSELENNIIKNILNLKSIIIAQRLHKETFSKYKNMFEGKDVYLICTGPTAKDFKPDNKDAIYVGVNGAIYLEDIPLDFIFSQDYAINQPHNKTLNEDIKNYKGRNCKKFYGIIPDTRLSITSSNDVLRIPLNHTNDENISQYILEDINCGHLAYDPAYEPLGDFSGTPFSAMQFIFYTNPKRIFLVGCDCNSGYAYNNNPPASSNQSYHIDIWKNHIKPFWQRYYANTEIISINPVGLKGVFKDMYTKKI